MTERLATLLHAEADLLQVPAPPSAEVLAAGHRLRRRRRWAMAAGSGVATAAAVAAAVLASGAMSPDSTRVDPPPAADEAYLTEGAFAVGTAVHFGASGRLVVETGEKIHSMYYTSAGVLVRSAKRENPENPGPGQFLLVHPEGETSRLSLELDAVSPSTDPSQPYLAFAERVGPDTDRWNVVVYDVVKDRPAATVPIDGSYTWAGWAAPPVALSGDHVYVGMDAGRVDVDWRAASVSEPDPAFSSIYPEIAGRYVVEDRTNRDDTKTQIKVLDVGTGELALTVDVDGWGMGLLSPNGRYLAVSATGPDEEVGPAQVGDYEVYDLATGEHRPISGDVPAGWTPDDQLLYVTRTQVSVCNPATGDCATTDVDLGDGKIKVGGRSYEV